MTLKEENRIALDKLTKQYANQVFPTNLPTAFSDDPWKFGFNIKKIGIKCSNCGGAVTGKNLAFYGFNSDVKCYACQQL